MWLRRNQNVFGYFEQPECNSLSIGHILGDYIANLTTAAQ